MKPLSSNLKESRLRNSCNREVNLPVKLSEITGGINAKYQHFCFLNSMAD